MTIRGIIFTLIFFEIFLADNFFSQNNSFNQIDCLKLELKKKTHDTIKLAVLSELVNTASETEFPKFNKDLENLCIKLQSNSNKRIKQLVNSCLINVYDVKGYLYLMDNDLDSSLYFSKKALQISVDTKDTVSIIHVLRGIGIIWAEKGETVESIDYYHKALKLAEIIKDEPGMGRLYSSIGTSNYFLGNAREALHYLQKSLKISLKFKDKKNIGDDYNTIGSIYSDLRVLDSAFYNHKKSYQFSINLQDSITLLINLNNIGHTFYNLKQYDSALCYYRLNLNIREKSNLKNKESATTYNNIGEVYLKKNILDSTEKYSNKALVVEMNTKRPAVLRNIYRVLEELYHRQGKFEKAYDMLSKASVIKDTLEGIEIRKAVDKKMMRYDFDKKQEYQKIEQEKKDIKNDGDLKRQKLITYFIIAGLLAIAVFAFYIFKNLKQQRKANKIISEQKHLVEEKQKEIIDSIRYAKRIQQSLLPTTKYIERILKKSN